ncbi:MAG: ketosteroid isomerase [Rhodospirillaceae bacterium]|nr:MAG: ketosteroid isomerase [Rhodospirillaceae bacterium]
MAHPNHQIARKFFAAFFTGTIPDDLLTPDMHAWTTLGPMDKTAYLGGLKAVIALFNGGRATFTYTIDAVTAEDDRVVVEIHSNGAFTDGEPYENTYIFVLRIRDGRVASIAEHFNPIPFMKQMLPRMQPEMAKALA